MKDVTCYICGSAEGRTKDHVFPRGLFTRPLPDDMLTAPACADCQQRLGPDEEYFRTFATAGAQKDPTAKELWEGKVPRSFERSPGFRQTFADAINTKEWRTPAGIIIGDVPGLEGDQTRIGNVLNKIVRGLSYLDSGGTVMPFDVNFNYSQVSPVTPPLPDSVREVLLGIRLRKVGDVVQYKFGFPPEEPRATMSWSAFYKRVMFAVWTWPEDVELPPRE